MSIGVIFPGQGTQHHGMGRPWNDTPSWPLVAQISHYSGVDVEELLLDADDERLRRTDLAQLEVFTVSALAHAEFARAASVAGGSGSWAPPVAYAGHSLGEYTALLAAGILPLADAAALVAARGRAMHAAAGERPGTMAVLLTDVTTVRALTDDVRAAGQAVWVANINGPGQVVVAGSDGGVDHAVELAQAQGVRTVRIPVGGAFHSPLMASATQPFREAVRAVRFGPGSSAVVVANVDAHPHTATAEWTELLTRQLTSPVQWHDSVRTLTGELGCRTLIELGTDGTLAAMVRRISRDVEVVSVANPDDLSALTDWFESQPRKELTEHV